MTTPGFRYGRRSPKRSPALRLGPLLTGTLPSPPSSVDYGTAFTGWQMLGNDVAGDCVAVTWANQRALVTTALKSATDYPSQAQVWAFYKTQNPRFDPSGTSSTDGPGSSDDQGMDIQTALEYLVKTGGPDGVKAVAFAAVDYTNENELRSAHAIFGQVWYGINVLDANQTEFSNGQAWDYVAGSPLDGGHSITGVGYEPTDYKFVTWARETEWTEAFRTHQVEEAWVVIWPEHLGTTQFEQGISLSQLAADYQAITGKTLVVPQPENLWHTIRSATGSWQPAGNAAAAARISGDPIAIGAAATSGSPAVQFMVATADGRLWHTIRSTTWQAAGNAAAAARISGNAIAVAAAGDANGNVQFMVATADGRLWHTIRSTTWTPAVDAAAAAGISGNAVCVAAATTAEGIQFLVGTADGRLWHAIQDPSGAWQPATDAAAAAGISGYPVAVAAAADASGDGQFLVGTADGRLWHAIRDSAGTWQPAANAATAVGIAGKPITSAAAGTPTGVQFMVGTTS